MRIRGEAYVPLDCHKCPLSEGRTQVVPAEGAPAPLAFFVGEAPGPDEDREGRPFIGRAGRILRRSLAEAGWREEEVWITNAVKCFPHEVENGKASIRRPSGAESQACRAHLRAEVDALQPKLLIALGKTAAESLLGAKVANLGALREKPPGQSNVGGAPVFVTFHPSGLHYGHATEAEFVEDLRRAREAALA